MRSLQGRLLVVFLVGYLDVLTLQEWMGTGATTDLLAQTVLSVLATLLALYALVVSPRSDFP
jgi:hypothetical protein